ncbi:MULTISPECIES: thioredoxin TrxC [unclassified Microbulbifer]|uniref:thioredoxin TrxC n=1 Tax=unclassified Microbulbifer TaxID=2619833 RepID=UPI001E5D2941|nr:thioredoxin TrxC [Microbulbifer sp. YPW16]UHQ55580.1 thioredoxin TrxC [Microbulbifer sp. YPW16]
MTDKSPLQILCPACGAINRIPPQRLADRPLCGKCRTRLLTGKPISAGDANFGRLVGETGLPLVVDFWASWCGPCQQFAPVFSDVASQMATRVIFAKVDTEANPRTSTNYQIRSIPTLVLFYGGKEFTRLSGALPRAQFQQWLEQQLATLGL